MNVTSFHFEVKPSAKISNDRKNYEIHHKIIAMLAKGESYLHLQKSKWITVIQKTYIDTRYIVQKMWLKSKMSSPTVCKRVSYSVLDKWKVQPKYMNTEGENCVRFCVHFHNSSERPFVDS